MLFFPIVAVWNILEIYFLWVNYKGRFKYELRESWLPQRWFQERIGVWSLILPFTLIEFAVVWVGFYVTFGTSDILAILMYNSIIFFMLGVKLFNLINDWKSATTFESSCLSCENREECNRFLEDVSCSRQSLRRAVTMAVDHDRIEENT